MHPCGLLNCNNNYKNELIKMDRKNFLSTLGLSSASLLAAACLGSCSKETVASAPTVDFTIDISQSQYAALTAPGGYVYSNGIIIATTSTGQIIAVSQTCTHQGATVVFQNTNTDFYCPRHGALFSASGAVTAGPASSNLKQYTVTVNGNLVRVHG